MISREELVRYLNKLLQIDTIDDYAPNGLQIEGKAQISHLITGVTASQDLIDAAIAKNADCLLVHHGFFWKNESRCITGMARRRIKALLSHDINLLGYHLPLDAHEVYGNNTQLAKVLDIEVIGPIEDSGKGRIVFVGNLPQPLSVEAFAGKLEIKLQRKPLVVAASERPIAKVAWCTGGAQSYFELAHALTDADAFVTGEASESNFHLAKELGMHFFAAGHHATERYGVQALGEHLADHFGLTHEYIDIDNPI